MLQRKMTAQKLIERSLSETSAEAIKAENERMKAEIEQTKLKAEQQTAPQADHWQSYILTQMEKLQGALTDTQKQLTEQQTGALQERLSMLATELERTRPERREAVNPLLSAKQSIEEAKALMELLAPSQTPPPAAGSGDQHLHAWTLRAQFDQRRWEAEREDKHSEAMARLEMERDLKHSELAMKAEHYQRLDRFFNDTAPKLIEVGQRLLDNFVTPRQAGANTAAAASQVQPPEGYESGACVQCENTILYKPEWGEVVCQRCGAIYKLSQEGSGPEPEQGTERTSPLSRWHAGIGPSIPIDDTSDEEATLG